MTKAIVILLAGVALGATALGEPPTSRSEVGRTNENAPVPKDRAGELEVFRTRARAAAAKLDFKNPRAVRQANAELAKVNADLTVYAKANGLKLTKQTYTQPSGGAIAAQSCPAKDGCSLDSANVSDKGVLYCTYTCVVMVPKKKPEASR